MATHVTKRHLFPQFPPAPRQTDIYHSLLVASGHWSPSILPALTFHPQGLGRSLRGKQTIICKPDKENESVGRV